MADESSITAKRRDVPAAAFCDRKWTWKYFDYQALSVGKLCPRDFL
jgi:hypothetical protein